MRKLFLTGLVTTTISSLTLPSYANFIISPLMQISTGYQTLKEPGNETPNPTTLAIALGSQLICQHFSRQTAMG